MKFKIIIAALFLLREFDVAGSGRGSFESEKQIFNTDKGQNDSLPVLNDLTKMESSSDVSFEQDISKIRNETQASAGEAEFQGNKGVFSLFMNTFKSCLNNAKKDQNVDDVGRFTKAFSQAADIMSNAYKAPSVSMKFVISSIAYIARALHLLSPKDQAIVKEEFSGAAGDDQAKLAAAQAKIEELMKNNADLLAQLQAKSSSGSIILNPEGVKETPTVDKVLDLAVEPMQDGVQGATLADTVSSVLQAAVKEKFSFLDDQDVKKVAQLVQAIKDAKITVANQLMQPVGDVYKELKAILYPEGLPGDGQITPRLLVELSQSGDAVLSGVAPKLNLSGILGDNKLKQVDRSGLVDSQQNQKPINPLMAGIAARARDLKKATPQDQSQKAESYVFKTPQEQIAAQYKVQTAAEDALRLEIASEVEAQFEQDLPSLRLAFLRKFQDKASLDNFDEQMNKAMDVEKQQRLDLAYNQNFEIINQAGKDAIAQFKDRVAQAQADPGVVARGVLKIKSSAISPEESNVRSNGVKAYKKIIDQIVEQQFEAEKIKWQKDYEYNNPGSNSQMMQVAMNRALKKMKEDAYQTVENKAALQQAGEDAVAAWKEAKVKTVKNSVVGSNKQVAQKDTVVLAKTDQSMAKYVEDNASNLLMSSQDRIDAQLEILKDLKAMRATNKNKFQFQQVLLDQYLKLNAPVESGEAIKLAYKIIVLRNMMRVG